MASTLWYPSLTNLGLNAMTRSQNHEQLHEFRVEYLVWEDLIMYAKVYDKERLVKYVTNCIFSANALLQGLHQHGVLEVFYVGGTT